MADAYCAVCDEPFKDARGLANHNRFKHAPAQPALTGVYDEDGSSPDVESGGVQATSEPAAEGEERRPQAPSSPDPKTRSLFDRIRREAPKDGGPVPRETEGKRETRPQAPKPRRVSTQEFWGDAIEASAQLVARTGYVPMSRAMAITSPVGGEIIEDATRGTLLDKAVQPVVRNAAKWQDLGDYLGFIFAIGAAQAQPEKAPIMLAFARKRLVNLLPKIAANMVKQRKKEKAAAEAIQTLMPEFAELDLGDDPITGLIQMLFAEPDQVPVPEPAVA